MARKNVIICDRCERESTSVGDNFKTVDLPILKDRGRAKTTTLTQDNEFDLCRNCYYALGQVLRNFLDMVTSVKERS